MVIINKILANHHVKLTSHQIEQIAEQKNELFLHLIEHGLTPKDVNNGIRQLIDSAIKRGLQLVAISSSSNAVFEMKCLGLYDKFLYVSSYDKPSLGSLSKQEKNQISPLTYAFKSLGIKGEDCIGLEDNIDGIIEFKKFKVFAVAIANFREDIKQEGDY
jgi:beta-phosphoglucomutase-like phosphatase (HAD superfamily)